MSHQLKLLVNCRSLGNKVDDFDLLLSSVQPAVVLGTESWLDVTVLDREVLPLVITVLGRTVNLRVVGIYSCTIRLALCSSQLCFGMCMCILQVVG